MKKFNVSAVLTEEEAAVIANMRRKRAEAERAERAKKFGRPIPLVPTPVDEVPSELKELLTALFGDDIDFKVRRGDEIPTPTPEPAKATLDDSAEMEAEDAKHQAELEAKEQAELSGYQATEKRQKAYEEYQSALDNFLASLYDNDFIINANYDSEGLHLSIEDVM